MCSSTIIVTSSFQVKVDVLNKTSVPWSEEGVIPSEPVYIADPNAEKPEEDAGGCTIPT